MKSLETYTFGSGAGGRTSGYDWEKILDGGIYQLTKKDGDFSSNATTFGAMARKAAMTRNVNCRVSIDTDEDVVILQAYPMSEEQKRENIVKLAQMKDKNKEWVKKNREKKIAEKAAGVAPAVTASDAPVFSAPVAPPKPTQPVQNGPGATKPGQQKPGTVKAKA